MKTWLWPNQIVGKRRSGELRDEHNATVAVAAGLLDALRDMVSQFGGRLEDNDDNAAVIDNARKMIRMAERGAK